MTIVRFFLNEIACFIKAFIDISSQKFKQLIASH